jgi:hypothetical protein
MRGTVIADGAGVGDDADVLGPQRAAIDPALIAGAASLEFADIHDASPCSGERRVSAASMAIAAPKARGGAPRRGRSEAEDGGRPAFLLREE